MPVDQFRVVVSLRLCEVGQTLVEKAESSIIGEAISGVKLRIEDEEWTDGIVLFGGILDGLIVGITEVSTMPENACCIA